MSLKPPLNPSRAFSKLYESLFYCPSCSLFRISSRSIRRPLRLTRRASTLASSTAVNATKTIPPQFQELYNALDQIKKKASGSINLGRLQLALKGLESQDPAIRIAVLGLDGSKAARKLVRLLLADPLSSPEPWEEQLDRSLDGENQSVLIRYGQRSGWLRQSGIPTLNVPSSILERHNLEFVISSLPTGSLEATNGAPISDTAFLSPALSVPVNDRITLVQYPVHKCLVLGNGLEGIVSYSRLLARLRGESLSSELVKEVFEVPTTLIGSESKSGSVTVINTTQAEEALAVFRKSLENSIAYERGWTGSRVSTVLDWLSKGSEARDGPLKPVVRNLIVSILENASQDLNTKESSRINELVASSVPETTRLELIEAISSWSERAHTELRDTLGVGFAGKRWKRLAWWKLLWRVDDVAMNAEEILANRWLPGAEKGIVYLSGRIWQAGLAEKGFQLHELAHNYAVIPLNANSPDSPPIEPPVRPPWPDIISSTRAELIQTTIPPLQALSQRLLLFSMSTTLLTSSLSILSYIAVSTTSAYEAGAIAALGFVYSLRRLQKKWEAAREFWKGEIREEGRLALKRTEELLKKVIKEGGIPKSDPAEVEGRKMARASLEDAVKALERVR